jgi:hypothetical protein
MQAGRANDESVGSSAYRAVSAALHTVDDDRSNLLLAGQHGFTPRVTRFASVPVTWDFPATRVFHTGAALFISGYRRGSPDPVRRDPQRRVQCRLRSRR